MGRPLPALLSLLSLLAALVAIPAGMGAIDCFKCASVDGANPACEDPFHNNASLKLLESPCMGGRKGRDGVFPATACIKIDGRYTDTGQTIVIRACALDSGTLTTDTELIRMSHCGSFYFENRYIRGCVQSCDDADGCNAAPAAASAPAAAVLLSAAAATLWGRRPC
ncbi:hypothetical protein ONE63_002733 [Megalurothrips usitatus]|uniref:Protein sleepless n=1 Tax=Megalurothrips usitatus TaxID=439358 RepID=A0AAV7X5U5_9NEOP|nr:hypothetical protein ONE63_002733 [Megalurothrips usitatus]